MATLFMAQKQTVSKYYKEFFFEIKERIQQSQYEAMRQVNRSLISLYWDIGKSIVEKQQNYQWGKAVVVTLAEDLQKEFEGMQGWSVANLWRMRKFYLTYAEDEKLARSCEKLVGVIIWRSWKKLKTR